MMSADQAIARRSQMLDRITVLGILVIFLALPFAAWSQHIYSSALAGRWLFLTAGALAFPVGVISGAGIWMGLWA